VLTPRSPLQNDTGTALGTLANPLRVDPINSTPQTVTGTVNAISPVLTTKSSGSSHITTNTNTQIVAAPGAGFHLRIHRLWCQNGSGGATTWCYWGNGSGDLVTGPACSLAANQPFGMDIKGAWVLSSNTGLFLSTATTGGDIGWYVEYETVAD
jgi:hypothetical protein